LGPSIGLVDAASFLAQYQTVIREEQYRFAAARPDPRILDCGANIGLTSIYWKRLYPHARIVAFEPDPDVFKVLSGNLDSLGFTDVTRLPNAVWSRVATLPFWAQGADAGRLLESTEQNLGQVRPVAAVRLRDYLNEATDLLKVDIEGAEVEVILDCSDRLDTVQNIVVEYHSFVDRPQRLDELLHAIISAGFRVHVLPDVVSSRPLVQKLDNYGMDLQLNVFGSRK
jgi:FkbM family methyltransferase